MGGAAREGECRGPGVGRQEQRQRRGFCVEPGKCCPLGSRGGRDRLIAKGGIWSGVYPVVLQTPFGPGGEEERVKPRAGQS